AKTEPPPAVGVTTPGLTIFDMAKQPTKEFVSDDQGQVSFLAVPPPGPAGQTTVNVTVGDTTVTLDLYTEPDSSPGGCPCTITWVSPPPTTPPIPIPIPDLPSGSTLQVVYEVMQQGTTDHASDGTVIRLMAQTQPLTGTSNTAAWLLAATGVVSGGQGQVSFTFTGQSGSTLDNNGYLARNVRLRAVADSCGQSDPSTVFRVGRIPEGSGSPPYYLTGATASGMTWSNANDYCASHGGKLPRIDNAPTLPSPLPSLSVTIDSVGTITATGSGSYYPSVTPWAHTDPSSGLPSYRYWTGTAHADFPGGSWLFDDYGGSVLLNYDDPGSARRVVCVP
ncbi:MAG: hypothetical protein FWG97_04490, partial [Deltaproteobacteria bacterium]|nr:hypothetical protein [Deltaproteobacteria bacterium]